MLPEELLLERTALPEELRTVPEPLLLRTLPEELLRTLPLELERTEDPLLLERTLLPPEREALLPEE